MKLQLNNKFSGDNYNRIIQEEKAIATCNQHCIRVNFFNLTLSNYVYGVGTYKNLHLSVSKSNGSVSIERNLID